MKILDDYAAVLGLAHDAVSRMDDKEHAAKCDRHVERFEDFMNRLFARHSALRDRRDSRPQCLR